MTQRRAGPRLIDAATLERDRLRAQRIDLLVEAARRPHLPALAFEAEPRLLQEVEEAIPEIAAQIEAEHGGIPINGRTRA